MKKHGTTIFLCLMMIIGLSLLLYPSFSDWWNSFHQTRIVTSYVEQVADIDEEEYQQIWNYAWEYNRTLLNRPNDFVLSDDQKLLYDYLLNVGENNVMGYIEIPKIDVMLPIYHGTSEAVLQTAIGHLEWTSLPVGGDSSHCVVSGHRGLPSARLFTDLDKMEAGDTFLLYVLDEVLTYEVDQIRIVDPDDTEELLIQEGKDLCTLVTCTPYGINSHRMLVRGHRVGTAEKTAIRRVTADAVQIEPIVIAPLVAAPMLLVLLLILLIPKPKKKRRME